MGFVIVIDTDRIAEYRRVHSDVWPGVLERLHRFNITNRTISCGSPKT